MKKSQLKSLVGFGAIQQLNPYLELLQLPLNEQEIPDNAARAIELAVPLVNGGMQIREALQQAIQQMQSEQGVDFDHASGQQIDSGLSARNQFMGELLKADLTNSAVDFQAAWYQLLPAAIHSQAVNNDPRVDQARKSAMEMVTGGQRGSGFFTTTLEIAKQSSLLTLSPSSMLMLSASPLNDQPEEKSNPASEDNQQPT
jgi:hypothetical protein